MQIIKTADLIFECEDDIEVMRAQTLLTKEPGTIAWLEKHLRPDDVFYDVGANIGCYTLFAAKRVPDGHVYAFEPNVINARSLLRNVSVNGMRERVTVLTMALDETPGCRAFNYASLRPGASGSQLGHTDGEGGQAFTPELVELKWAVRMSSLFEIGPRAEAYMPKPDVVKIDVDGNEHRIIAGMWGIYCRTVPRTVQVEMHAKDDEAIVGTLEKDFGLHLDHRHHTSRGQKMIDKGADPMSVPHNAVFVR